MPIEDFWVNPLTVINPGSTTDRNGNVLLDWANPTSEIDTAGWLQDITGSEVQGGRDTLVSTHTLYLPPDTLINGQSRVVLDGLTFEVTGPPKTARTPEGPHHLELSLRLVDALQGVMS